MTSAGAVRCLCSVISARQMQRERPRDDAVRVTSSRTGCCSRCSPAEQFSVMRRIGTDTGAVTSLG